MDGLQRATLADVHTSYRQAMTKSRLLARETLHFVISSANIDDIELLTDTWQVRKGECNENAGAVFIRVEHDN